MTGSYLWVVCSTRKKLTGFGLSFASWFFYVLNKRKRLILFILSSLSLEWKDLAVSKHASLVRCFERKLYLFSFLFHPPIYVLFALQRKMNFFSFYNVCSDLIRQRLNWQKQRRRCPKLKRPLSPFLPI
jgi:hypothetical protein